MTSNNWLDFGGDSVHVTLGLGVGQRCDHCECFCIIIDNEINTEKEPAYSVVRPLMNVGCSYKNTKNIEVIFLSCS